MSKALQEGLEMSCWRDVVDFCFPSSTFLPALPDGTTTAMYSGANLPDVPVPNIAIFDKEGSILRRAKEALQRGFDNLPDNADDSFPTADINSPLKQFVRMVQVAKTETECSWAAMQLFTAVTVLAEALHLLHGDSSLVVCQQPQLEFSQQGDCNIFAGTACTTSVENKKHSVLTHHWRDLGDRFVLKGEECKDLEAILFKLCLQMRSATPSARFGMVMSGRSFALVEWCNREGQNPALLVSPVYSVFGGDRRAQVLACVLAFACCTLPGFEIESPPGEVAARPHQPIIPEVVEPESGKAVVKIDPHPSDVLPIGSLFDESGIGQRILPELAHFARNPQEIGRPSCRIQFVPFSASGVPSRPTFMTEVIDFAWSYISPWLSSLCRSDSTVSKIPPDVQNFLQLPWRQTPVQLFSHDPCNIQPLKFALGDLIGRGRTGHVRHASLPKGSTLKPLVAKIISVRELASIVRETLFYQYVFPGSAVAQYVPQYYGTYASCSGGWYVIVLEHVGQPVQSLQDDFLESDMTFVRDLKNKFSAAGICHGDIRPPNVLRGPDGGLRLIDFGFSTLFDFTEIVA